MTVLQTLNNYPHCTDEETEAQGGYATCPRSHSLKGGNSNWKPSDGHQSAPLGLKVLQAGGDFISSYISHVLRLPGERATSGPPGKGDPTHSAPPAQRGNEICGHCSPNLWLLI